MTADFFQLIGSLFRILKEYSSNILAGPQHREIGTPISTGNASWGGTTK
ncbi:Nitrogen regulation protein NIFR3 [Staphylococcus aureus]|uniref:Nitrogen regulation protein NIFR3 n=1 Tax=Staphylococcus aureus TaxID=1280 RepID=A0A380DXS2_STAAU|nr:Nitrogen regulation protein NIFR3 [Staphylococcus aureus]